MRAEEHVPCECGRALGERCAWHGPRSVTVVVEWMPEWLRANHRNCSNMGAYPQNGSERLRVEATCAERMMRDNEPDYEWCTIVEEG